VDVLTVLPPDERLLLLVDDDVRRDDAVVFRVVRRAGADFFEVLATTIPLPNRTVAGRGYPSCTASSPPKQAM
jgi:hypothetical protein